MAKNFHEQLDRPDLPLPSDRSVGLVFATVALIVAFFWRTHELTLIISLVIAAILGLVSFTIPKVLRPLNIVWMRFALLISKVVNPVVMLILFIITIVPAGLIMRLSYDPLRRRGDASSKSYWIVRDKEEHSSLRNQF